MDRKTILKAVFLLCLALLSASCGGTESRKLKFFNRGKALYEKGDYTRARLEFKNAVQTAPRFAEGYYMLGMVEFQEKNWRNAFAFFSEAVRLDPARMSAQIKLGQIYLAARAPDRAMEKADLALKADANNEDALLLKAAVCLAKQEPDKAIACLEGLHARGLRSPDLFLMTASACMQKKDLRKAEEALTSGIGANPKSVLVHLALVDFYLRMGRPDDAVGVLRAVIRLSPDAPDHRLVLAGILWDKGRVPEATEVLSGITGELKGDERWVAVAMFYLQKGRPEAAEEELKKGLRDNAKSVVIRFALSDLYMKTSRSDEAVALLKESVALLAPRETGKPDLLRAKNALVRIRLARHETGEAERYIDEVLADSPKNLEARFQKGTIQLQRGEGSDAVAQFRDILNENPGSVPALLRLAEAHVVNGEPNLAEDCLQTALKANPSSIEVQRAIGRLYAAKGEFAKAEEYLRKLHEAHPEDVGVIAEMADAFLLAGDVKRAEAGFREIERKEPRSPLGYEKMGRLYLARQKYGEAAAELVAAVRIAPQSEELRTLLADAYAKQGKYDAALRLCDERLKQDPKDAPAWALKAYLFEGMKDFPKAEDALRKAVGFRPLWAAPRVNLARLLLARGKYGQAAKDLEDALKTDPGDPAFSILLAQAYYRNRDRRRAMDACEKLLKEHPNFWMAANALAFMLAEQAGGKADLDRALVLAQKAQKLRPNQPSVMDTIGWVYYKKGDIDPALQWIGKAHAASPADPVVNYHMGMVFFRAGKRQEAKQFLGRALAGGEDFTGLDEARETMKQL
jgi:tetratricopeptide (TPR) repeat protein